MKRAFIVLALSVLLAVPASASLVNFTGGTVTFANATTGTTNNSSSFSNVDYYTQGGYKFDFIGDASIQFVGNYYGVGNDVLHAHFDGSTLTQIRVSRVDGALFDLQSLRVTSNTQIGGGNATGQELTYVNASQDGSTYSTSQLLPSENWGYASSTMVNFGSGFTNMKFFDITVSNYVFCVGIDDVTMVESIQEVPVPSSVVMSGIGGVFIMGYSMLRYRRNARLAAQAK